MNSGIDRKYGLSIIDSEAPIHRTGIAAIVFEIHRHRSPDLRPFLAGDGNFDWDTSPIALPFAYKLGHGLFSSYGPEVARGLGREPHAEYKHENQRTMSSRPFHDAFLPRRIDP